MARTRERRGQMVPQTGREIAPLEEMDRLFDRLFEGGLLRPFAMRWPEMTGSARMTGLTPRIDVIDREAELVVRAELPGVQKDALELTLSDDNLTLRGEVHERTEESGEYYHTEIRHGSFSRTIRLPQQVQADKVKAEFADGLLEVTLPKAEPARRRMIDIA